MAYLIPFKAKAWLDLTDRKTSGEHVDSKNIKKHKNDVFRLTELIDPTLTIKAPHRVYVDVQEFIQRMQNESVDVKQLGLVGRTKDQILKEIINVNLKMYSFDHLRMYNIDHINTCCSRW